MIGTTVLKTFPYLDRNDTTMKKTLKNLLALSVCLIAGSLAYAAVTFDPASGTGFVGKGDVQQALGLNNAQLQAQANTLKDQFYAVSTVVSERTWTCTSSNPQSTTQERLRTTTETIQGVVAAVARERNQVTGFILEGYGGHPVEISETEGNVLNSCPNGPWSLTQPAGDPEVINSSTVLTVNGKELS
jgi:hypothetical protein